MLFTVVTSLAVGFAATLANAGPPNAAHAASDISDSCDAGISNDKCCFAATVKQDLGNGKVQDWGYVKATKTGQVLVGFDINAYPQGFFCLQGGFITDAIDNVCDFKAHDEVFQCRPIPKMGEGEFDTVKTSLPDGSEIVALTLQGNARFRICPIDSKQSLFHILRDGSDGRNGCHTINLALDPKTPDTCPK
ncbi:hypothetical protein CKAH01_02607 [Colletotrichum kahawae]|uniref:Uncharacterized protein n=1 Tax=Colletotrichum kahawae TaxID=34407 RepID=A0AAE0CZD2_COLKA|nr:hypothetical protein CKAH01_02607 [Colletotrichum kahawae]